LILWPIKTIAQTNGNNECIYCNDGHIGPWFYPQMTPINSKGLPKVVCLFRKFTSKLPTQIPKQVVPNILLFFPFIYRKYFPTSQKYSKLVYLIMKILFPKFVSQNVLKVSDKCF
jgi:hypothetical protein